MQNDPHTIVTSMHRSVMSPWKREKRSPGHRTGRLAYTSASILSIAILCACFADSTASVSVMNYVDSGFDYDETLGRLQYVSNILPESAMVFLTSDTNELLFSSPADTNIVHAWSQGEPWIEYDGICDISACQAGEIMTIVKSREDEYTVRLLHENGYESVYSGLQSVMGVEGDMIRAGETIGSSSRTAAFELRKDGVSVLPVFHEL